MGCQDAPHRVVMLDNACLVKLAMVDGSTLGAYQSVIAAADNFGSVLWIHFLSNIFSTFLTLRLL